MKIVLQYTTGAFSGEIPESAWRTAAGEYRKVDTADAALEQARAEMRERCGPSAWDSHYQLVNAGTLPIRLTYTYECYGAYWVHQHHPECHVSVTIEQDWAPGEPKPRSPWARLLETHGWNGNTCPACSTLDAEHDRRIRAQIA